LKYDKRIGIALFAVLIAVAIGSSFYITPLSISDSDPSTYVIVPLLMLLLFAMFTAKEKIKPEVKRKDILIGLFVFLLLILITVYLRFELSYLFISYRIDMLLFPLLIATLAIVLFGLKNLDKFRAMAIYALLASSLLMTPFIEANQGFAVFNTVVVYSVARVFIHNLSYIPPITITANGYQVGIGQTCVGIGVLIAIVLFLLPIAYLYEGSVKRKVLWIASGFALLLLLNIIRMFSIATAWLIYGPSNAILGIHIFAGILLFYLSIIAMILLSGRYGLSIGVGKKTKETRSKGKTYYKMGIVAAVLIAFAYFAFTYNYSSALDVSQIYLNNNMKPEFNATNVAFLFQSVLNTSGFNSTLRLNGNNGAAVLLWGNGIGKSDPLLAYITYPNGTFNSEIAYRNDTLGVLYLLNNRGLSGTVYDVESNGTEFLVYNTGIPYSLPGRDVSSKLSVYLILPVEEVGNVACHGGYDVFYTDLLNILNPSMYNGAARTKMIEGYCLFNKLVV
jgi:exosortase/archaeosortase family protein